MGKAKYPKYKSSKTLWQEQIPSHWQETELRMLFADNKNKNIGLVERNLLSLSYGKLKRKDIDNATGLVPASFEGYQIIDKGYIVLRFTDLQNDKKSLRVGYANEKGIITNAYIGLAPKTDIHSKYFYYQLHFLDKIKYFYNLGGGVRQSLVFKEFGRETILVPDKEEQIKIVSFLDFKLSKIERFISKKKSLIKLLIEQKAGIINDAVTGKIGDELLGVSDKRLGISDKLTTKNSPLTTKSSGIEWLGDIPEHWEVRKLKYVADLQSGEMITSEAISQEGEYPVFGGGGFRGYTNNYTNDGYYVLIGRQGALCGNIKYANGKFWASEHSIVTYPKIEIETIYLGEILTVCNLGKLSQTAAQPGIAIGQIKNVYIPLPPLSEQQQIVSHIKTETATINKTIATIEKEIALVEEYKTALIAEAVTGKIDVRDYEIPENIAEETFEELEEDIELNEEYDDNPTNK